MTVGTSQKPAEKISASSRKGPALIWVPICNTGICDIKSYEALEGQKAFDLHDECPGGAGEITWVRYRRNDA